ncbi:MAG TPA: substrate-binding domain-containing protein [Bryobacteraceae bacterium]
MKLWAGSQKRYPGSRAGMKIGFLALLIVAISGGFVLIHRYEEPPPLIAVVPRTTGSTLWENERAGVDAAAREWRYRTYWNAPTHEDDISGQIHLLEKVRAGPYAGLILAPDHALALLTIIRETLAAGKPVVIISSRLALPPRGDLSYVITDQKQMGKLAAARIGQALHGTGTVAVLGIDPGIAGIASRQRAFEAALQSEYPSIRIVARGPGAFNAAEAQESLIGALTAHPQLSAVFALTAVSTRAAYFTLKSSGKSSRTTLVGCEQDSDMINFVRAGKINAVLAEDTYRMGYLAVREIHARLSHRQVPPVTILPPVLVTRENASSARISRMVDYYQGEPAL